MYLRKYRLCVTVSCITQESSHLKSEDTWCPERAKTEFCKDHLVKSILFKKKNITNITSLNLLEAHTESSASKCFSAFPPRRVSTKSYLLELSKHQQLLAQLDRLLTQTMTMQTHFKLEWYSLLS